MSSPVDPARAHAARYIEAVERYPDPSVADVAEDILCMDELTRRATIGALHARLALGAAQVDARSNWHVFWRVVLRLVRGVESGAATTSPVVRQRKGNEEAPRWG